jgi:hypothetical protein
MWQKKAVVILLVLGCIRRPWSASTSEVRMLAGGGTPTGKVPRSPPPFLSDRNPARTCTQGTPNSDRLFVWGGWLLCWWFGVGQEGGVCGGGWGEGRGTLVVA